ncbi:hypothetical protein BKA70DRAFT_1382416 [Coprinopsis sp. MPI-PUGE-AT-0042]|nr:hypothetical protein BKA70DRAFT_1382416 [Coprinopsis sp. MPI-PUGE-AT-0042]
MSEFAPKPGCPMCGIVASAAHTTPHSPRSPVFPLGSTQPEVVWRDDNFTVYREKANPVSSKGHLIIAFNLHVPSIYTLQTMQQPPSSPQRHPRNSPTKTPITNNKIPVTDHLHAHAYIAPADLLGWWRGVAYSGLAWYEVDDLIAEIRESVSNNRVKSGYESRKAPIDSVPTAGARAGFADGTETTESGLANSTPTLEDGGIPPTVGGSSSLGRPRTPTLVT